MKYKYFAYSCFSKQNNPLQLHMIIVTFRARTNFCILLPPVLKVRDRVLARLVVTLAKI